MAKSKEDVQEVLQAKFQEIGVKVSKETAWKGFKACIDAVVDTCLKDDKNTVSLSGVGKFEILRVVPRQSKVGVVEFIPRLRFRPSTRINEFIEEAMGQKPDADKRQAEVARRLHVIAGKYAKTARICRQ